MYVRDLLLLLRGDLETWPSQASISKAYRREWLLQVRSMNLEMVWLVMVGRICHTKRYKQLREI
ncbi:hypothetical protein RB25_21640 [Herbaspirillum rubrisubalbicans]|nr:hypothetical protein RB25_21640 [Herbaspirillum rubrisubalbicans]